MVEAKFDAFDPDIDYWNEHSHERSALMRVLVLGSPGYFHTGVYLRNYCSCALEQRGVDAAGKV
jgi:hypothetical protein